MYKAASQAQSFLGRRGSASLRENRRGAPFDADPTDEEEPESLRRARDERFALNKIGRAHV